MKPFHFRHYVYHSCVFFFLDLFESPTVGPLDGTNESSPPTVWLESQHFLPLLEFPLPTKQQWQEFPLPLQLRKFKANRSLRHTLLNNSARSTRCGAITHGLVREVSTRCAIIMWRPCSAVCSAASIRRHSHIFSVSFKRVIQWLMYYFLYIYNNIYIYI